jgi:hypothetical protein
MAMTHKDLNTLEFPRRLHKDGAELQVADAYAAAEAINAGWMLRPGEPMATTRSGEYDAKPKGKK